MLASGSGISGFCDYIREARARSGWSLREAAKRTGISHSRLFELEAGISSKTGKSVVPTQDNIEKLADGYKLPIDHLFALAFFPEFLKTQAGITSKELGVVALYRDLSEARRNLWLTLGEGLKRLPKE